MKRIAAAAVLMVTLIFLLLFTTQMLATIDTSAVNGTALENVSQSVLNWSELSTKMMTPTIGIVAIGTIVLAVYTLTRKRR